ncbi:hypothetical protein PFISCL1PPCAC_14409, partial [Pristionchus fissidentatus]
LLACLAICDCCVFLSMILDSIITYEKFYVLSSVRIFFYEYREYSAFLSNWFAAASVWFVLAICIDRLLIVRYPFRSLSNHQDRQVLVIALVIMFLTCIFSQVNRFTNVCFWIESCFNTQIRGFCFHSAMDYSQNHVPHWLRKIVPKWMIFNSFAVVIIPIAIVIIINVWLIRIVKSINHQDLLRDSTTIRARRSDEQERSMTRAIVAIVTCFSVTQGPSGLLYLAINLYTVTGTAMPQLLQRILGSLLVLTNMLVLTGKMLNFVLFCLTSATFRVRLLNTMTMWCYKLGLTKRPVLNRDASRTMLTAKSSVASYHWKRGRSGHGDSLMMKSIKKKISTADSTINNNGVPRTNGCPSSGSRSSQDSTNGSQTNNNKPFMTNHSA